jgi:diacylglycerol kinase family enzyme
MRTSITLNPNAGSATDVETLEIALQILPDTSTIRTQAAGDATHFAQEALAKNFELVVAAGGDATL